MKTWTTLVSFLWLAATSSATDRFYDDVKASSGNGKYRAEAVSPQNAGGGRRAFQDEFTVSLAEAATGRTLWSWKQPSGAASPVSLVISDDGVVIMEDAWDTFHVFDPAGNPHAVISPLREFPGSEIKEYADFTTAGTFWQQFAMSGFVHESGRDLWYFRTYWGRLFAIDYHAAALLRDPVLEARLEDRIVHETRSWLAGFGGTFIGPCGSCSNPTILPEVAKRAFVVLQYGLSPDDGFVKDVIRNSDEGHHPDIKDYLARMTGKHARKQRYRILAWAGAAILLSLLAVLATRAFRRRKTPAVA